MIIETLLCSNCFENHGLTLEAMKIGVENNDPCPNCKATHGMKLDKKLLIELATNFFVKGTFVKQHYGGSSRLQFNEYQYKKADVKFQCSSKDARLIEEKIKIGFFYYGPHTWKVGEIGPLKLLQSNNNDRNQVIQRVMNEFPKRTLCENETFYRLRKNPENPLNHAEYDSPPPHSQGAGRLESEFLPIMYGSPILEICIHECRSTIEDDLYIATLQPTKSLHLLDLTENIRDGSNLWESLSLTIRMLFFAKEHSYNISREIAVAAYNSGFDGIVFPSYFSIVHTAGKPLDTMHGIPTSKIPTYPSVSKQHIAANIALFGTPIKNKTVTVKSINRLILNQITYNVSFGPADFD